MNKPILLFLILLAGFSLKSEAQGNLLVAPTIVVFDGKKQKDELNLVNMGNDTAVYSVSFVHYRMKEDGSYEIIESKDSAQMSAEPYLRVFPRKVTLAPRESQVIILQCRWKPDMKPAEYRSHVYFRSEKEGQPFGMKTRSESNVSVKLIPIFGISIPVIVRIGEGSVNTTLSDLKLETKQDSLQYLDLSINRTGNFSINGDVIVQYIPVEGKPYEIGKVKGVRVFTEINKRNLAIKLNISSHRKLTTGKLKVQYVSNDQKKNVVFAEGEMEIESEE